MLKKNKRLRNIKLTMMTLLMVIAIIAIKVKGITPHYKDDVGKSCDLEYEYLFLGDSITYRNDWNYFYMKNTIMNSGVDGNTTEKVLERLSSDVYFYHPKNVILLIGINDLYKEIDLKKTISNVEEIITSIQKNLPKTNIYLQSIYPINNNIRRKKNLNITNSHIMKINEQYKNIAKKHRITYIDVYSRLLDDQGNLNRIYTKDGLHLSLQGYIAVTEVLNEYIIKQTETSNK